MIRAEVVALSLAEPAESRLAGVGAWLGAVADRAEWVDTRGVTWLVVSPLALPERGRLEAELAALGVRLRGRTTLPRWSRIATALRVRDPHPPPERLRTAALFESAWDALFPYAHAEAWALAPGGDHGRVERAKQRLRSRMRHLCVDFGVAGMEPRILSPFHLADGGDADEEARRLVAAAGLGDEGEWGGAEARKGRAA